MSKSKHHSPLVQKLITSYFPTEVVHRGLLSLSYTHDSRSSEFCYVSETPMSKLGNDDYHLGKCNAISEDSSKQALFDVSAVFLDSFGSFNHSPSISNVNFCMGSPTWSSESVAMRRWKAIRIWWVLNDFHVHFYSQLLSLGSTVHLVYYLVLVLHTYLTSVSLYCKCASLVGCCPWETLQRDSDNIMESIDQVL